MLPFYDFNFVFSKEEFLLRLNTAVQSMYNIYCGFGKPKTQCICFMERVCLHIIQ